VLTPVARYSARRFPSWAQRSNRDGHLAAQGCPGLSARFQGAFNQGTHRLMNASSIPCDDFHRKSFAEAKDFGESLPIRKYRGRVLTAVNDQFSRDRILSWARWLTNGLNPVQKTRGPEQIARQGQSAPFQGFQNKGMFCQKPRPIHSVRGLLRLRLRFRRAC
jgi:hypothetical protein